MSSRGYSARPAPYGVSYHGAVGLAATVHSPCGPATVATRLWPPEGCFLILTVVAANLFAAVTVAAVPYPPFTLNDSPQEPLRPCGEKVLGLGRRPGARGRRSAGSNRCPPGTWTKAGHLLDACSLSAVRLGRSDTDIEEGGAGTFRGLLRRRRSPTGYGPLHQASQGRAACQFGHETVAA